MQNISKPWEFVEKYYPNYSESDIIAENDDFSKIVNGQLDGEAEKLYNSELEEARIFWGGGLDEEQLHNEVIKTFTNQLNESNSFIYQKAIQGFIDSEKELVKTYYLFGSDVVKEYNFEGIDSAIELINENENHEVFIFIEGETRSSELASALMGWNDFAIITEEEYNKIINC